MNRWKQSGLAALMVITLGLAACQNPGGSSQDALESINTGSTPALPSSDASMGDHSMGASPSESESPEASESP